VSRWLPSALQDSSAQEQLIIAQAILVFLFSTGTVFYFLFAVYSARHSGP
jgi:hypothetical protein